MNKPKNIGNKEIKNFLDEVAGRSPTPGGGAVAAIVGAMAASLVEMVCGLTKETKELKKLRTEAGASRDKLLRLADEDVKAFNGVMTAYKSPAKQGPALRDKSKIRKALTHAMEVPAETARLAREVGKMAKRVAKIGNKNAYSDAMSAVYLAQAASKSALENVEINKKALKNID